MKLTADYMANVKRKNVLALDCATTTGFYSIHDYGSWTFPSDEAAPKKLGPDYQQHKAFHDKIVEYVKEHDIKVIAAEDVNVGTKFNALRKLAQLQGVLYYTCAELGIPLVVFNVTNIKKHATGNGRATKAEMMAAAAKRYHIDAEGDDNAGDAAHIFFYFCHRYQI